MNVACSTIAYSYRNSNAVTVQPKALDMLHKLSGQKQTSLHQDDHMVTTFSAVDALRLRGQALE